MNTLASLLLPALAAAGSGSLRGQVPNSNLPRALRVGNTRGIYFPSFRFLPWCALDEDTQAQATDVFWTSETWDNPGTAEGELNTFANIKKQSEKKETTVMESMVAMGWTEDVYDCYVNHYDGYEWKDLEKNTDTIPYWTGLGWNSSSWSGETAYPASEDKEWDELSEKERASAIALCFFEELWDFTNLMLWDVYEDYDVCEMGVPIDIDSSFIDSLENSTFVPSTIAPTMEETGRSTFVVSEGDLEELEEEAIEAAEKEDMEEYEDMEDGEDVDEETDEEEDKKQDEEEEEDVELTPTSQPTKSPVAGSSSYIANPMNRFLLWSWLFDVSQHAAETLGYDEESWNANSLPMVESLVFDDLTTEQKEAAYVLGLAPAVVWDCNINHYQGYSWDELKEVKVQEYYTTLGWNKDSWNVLAWPPKTDGAPFDTLTQEQQAAAKQLCYREETWDKLPLADWVL